MRLRILGFAGLACVIGGTAAAQTAPAAGPDRQPGTAAKATSDPFAQALAARSVAEFARRQQDAAAMVVAARMLQEIPFADAESADATFTPKGLFDEARRLARGDRILLAQIQVAQSNGSRGVSNSAFGKGLVRKVQTVLARTNYQFAVQAIGGEPLRVGAIGDVGTALAMTVRDGAGRAVCVDDHGDYGPVCQLTPSKNADYKIEIQNKSAVSSRAVILSN